MLPKPQRLPHSTRLFSAHTRKTEFFLLRVLSTDLPTARFGVVISKKVDKRAVLRNGMRRQIHQMIQDHFLGLKGLDVLFVVQKPFEKLSEELLHDVTSFLQGK